MIAPSEANGHAPDPDGGIGPAASPGGAAARALSEAAARRSARAAAEKARPREIDGRPGPEPVRYGDWENRGIASDF